MKNKCYNLNLKKRKQSGQQKKIDFNNIIMIFQIK